MTEKKVSFDRLEQAVALFGSFDENVKLISKTYNAVSYTHLDVYKRQFLC